MFHTFFSLSRSSIWDVLLQRRPTARTCRGTFYGMQWPLQICFFIKSFLEFQVWPWCHNEKFWPLTENLLGIRIRLACCNWGGFLSSLTLSQEFFILFCLFVFKCNAGTDCWFGRVCSLCSTGVAQSSVAL